MGGFLCCRRISIHALREEGDLVIQPFGQMLEDFYPRPPRGGRPKISPNRTSPRKFLSTPSARRATVLVFFLEALLHDFYPRPPRGGRRTMFLPVSTPSVFLSTPSARRATAQSRPALHTTAYFYPRPPRGGRLSYPQIGRWTTRISIHALREEGDRKRQLAGPNR